MRKCRLSATATVSAHTTEAGTLGDALKEAGDRPVILSVGNDGADVEKEW